MMRLDELQRYGLPQRLIDSWRRRQGETLLPVQGRAIRLGLLGQPGERIEEQPPVRMVISAPTASGKSFCAELAIARALTQRRKAVLLVPLKSLAEQKYRSFRRTFGALGVRCLIATGDYPENDRALHDADFDIALVIYEKFDRLLAANLGILCSVGLLAVDEVQTISEPGRGAALERLLTRVLASVYRPSLVALSAVIGEGRRAAGRLAEWLGAALVVECRRPVDLLCGVAADGDFRYRSFNSGLEANEPFGVSSGDAGELFDSLIERLRDESGSTLVFLKSRRETVEAALRLAAAVSWPEATHGIARLAGEEPSYLNRALQRVLARGVAFHNADLSPRQRSVVESCFVHKHVKVIFATTTLAMGVDLPADTVYLETVKYTGGAYDSKPSLVPVSRAEFENMAGRAGRTGRPNVAPGRAVAIAGNEFERDILWEHYIVSSDGAAVRSAFDSVPLEDWVLDMLVGGLADSVESLAAVYARTLRASIDPDSPPPAFATALAKLREAALVQEMPQGWRPTEAGESAALAGLSCAQADHYRRLLEHGAPHTPFGWIAAALSAPDWAPPAAILSRCEQADNGPVRMLHRHFDHLLDEARVLIGDHLSPRAVDYRVVAALKAALLLERWREMAPVQRLEEQFQLHVGQIMAIGESCAHLLAGLAGMIEATAPDGRADSVRELAFSVRFGITPELRDMHEAFRSFLVRSDFAALAAAGITRLPDLVERTPEQIAAIINCDVKSKQINKKIAILKQEVYMPQVDVSLRPTISRRRPSLAVRSFGLRPVSVEIDGAYEKERYLVRIDGSPVWLTGKSFKYLTRLAWSRLHQETGWMFKEDIERGFNQARYLYRMKNEINDCLPNGWEVFENNRLGYYRLNAEAASIRLNAETLRAHPDFEVSSLFAVQAQPGVN